MLIGRYERVLWHQSSNYGKGTVANIKLVFLYKNNLLEKYEFFDKKLKGGYKYLNLSSGTKSIISS